MRLGGGLRSAHNPLRCGIVSSWKSFARFPWHYTWDLGQSSLWPAPPNSTGRQFLGKTTSKSLSVRSVGKHGHHGGPQRHVHKWKGGKARTQVGKTRRRVLVEAHQECCTPAKGPLKQWRTLFLALESFSSSIHGCAFTVSRKLPAPPLWGKAKTFDSPQEKIV